ncbi:unnamed protein product, partial [Darwinula stevensoni]
GLIAWRYLRASRKANQNRFISFFSMLSIGGIALGVAALIVVLSVMNGFQKEVRDRMLAVIAHAEVYPMNQGPMENWPTVLQSTLKLPYVKGAAPFTQAQAMMVREDVVRGVVLKGISPAHEGLVSDLPKQIIEGDLKNLQTGSFGIALGEQLAKVLMVTVGDKVTVMLPEGSITPAGMVPRLKNMTVVAIFRAGHYEFDSSWGFMAIDDLNKMLRIDAPSGIRLKFDKMLEAPQLAKQTMQTLGPNYWVQDWSVQNRTWFAAVKTEKRMMFLILLMIIAVAMFNLVSSLVMTVTEKQGDIAIMRSMGTSSGSIMKIFMTQGFLIGLLGIGFGLLFGCLIAVNVGRIVKFVEMVLGISFLPQQIYFISEMPSELRFDDVSIIVVVALSLPLFPAVKRHKLTQLRPYDMNNLSSQPVSYTTTQNLALLTLSARQVSKKFINSTGEVLTILDQVSLAVAPGELVAIIGASGSGKSTLMHILGGLDDPDQGEICIAGVDLARTHGKSRDALRNEKIGFIYQFHHLLPEFTAQENVAMPLWIRGIPKSQGLAMARDALNSVGLLSRLEHVPASLSGGERQRVAIARSLVTEPTCILADEPTGNLDQANAEKVMTLMFKETRERKMSLVLVTHDTAIASRCDTVYRLVGGQLERVHV